MPSPCGESRYEGISHIVYPLAAQILSGGEHRGHDLLDWHHFSAELVNHGDLKPLDPTSCYVVMAFDWSLVLIPLHSDDATIAVTGTQ